MHFVINEQQLNGSVTIGFNTSLISAGSFDEAVSALQAILDKIDPTVTVKTHIQRDTKVAQYYIPVGEKNPWLIIGTMTDKSPNFLNKERRTCVR